VNLEPAYVALGSNQNGPQAQIRMAVEELAMLPDTRLGAVSSLYRSAPVGYLEQPDFVNAVALIETALAPAPLLDALLAIEGRHARVRSFPNAPRTLDLDLVLYAQREIEEPGLTLPHPRMHERAFVLVPLAEIAPDLIVPGRGRLSELLANVDASSVKLIERLQQ
jgi:2-amino-4-hydroxy-6-hydroxymethyldihydropteridine diphosphokinase